MRFCWRGWLWFKKWEEEQWKFFRFEVGCRPSKGGTGNQGCENARILEPG